MRNFKLVKPFFSGYLDLHGDSDYKPNKQQRIELRETHQNFNKSRGQEGKGKRTGISPVTHLKREPEIAIASEV